MKKQSLLKKIGKKIERFFVRIKQRLIVYYLINHCGGKEIINKYKAYTLEKSKPITDNSPIWTCWWQGEENMPPIVKACYKAMQLHANNHPLILITEKNYHEYVDLPDIIIQKRQKGIIDITHFSDILRMMLLSKYGGIWMDSTLLLPSPNIDSFINTTEKFWSCHHLPIYHNISQGGWTSFFLACGKENPLPAFIADMHLKYWSTHNKLIDYLLLDYTFAIARANIPCIHDMIEKTPISVMGPLGKCMNDEYIPEEWNAYCNNYNFHKLTYKIPLTLKNSQGKKTYYGHIMETFQSSFIN